MSKENLLTTSVMFLLFLNLSTLGYFFFSRPPRSPELWKLVVERAGFDNQQRDRYLLLRDAHHQGMNQLDDEFGHVLHQYLGQIKSAPDSSAETVLSNQLAEIEKQKAALTLDHFRKVKALCTPDQVEKFDALIPELTIIMLPPKDPRQPRRKP